MSEHQAIAIVGVGAIMPDAPDAKAFWGNIRGGRYSISDVPADRWDPALYYDVDPKAPDKTYSKIGGWVRSAPWDPMAWKLAIPPRVVDAMDEGQRWAVAATREALADYGYPNRALDLERTAVILGNAMGGEKHYRTTLRASFPEYADWLSRGLAFGALPEATRRLILDELANTVGGALPPITEDSMPGELSNCIAGRIANIFNLHGPNFTCDAACASALAAISAAREGLIEGDFDAVITGGVDRNMSASTFVKFCKIGALSATGTRPFADGADGFVMGEGAAIFILKRLADAERAGDRIYAVLRGMAGSSDGKGKGITAPNPVGQKLAVARAWADAGVSIRAGALIEAHGTSTKVGDVVEVGSLTDVLGPGLAHRSVALGSVKSNIGHLKGAAGAAGLFKAVMSLHEKVLPPSLGFKNPNPNIDFSSSPFYVNQELCDWSLPNGDVRQAAVSAFGFGGTNFHVVLEEHREGRLTRKAQGRGFESVPRAEGEPLHARAPLRGIALVTGSSSDELARGLEAWLARAKNGVAPPPAPPSASELRAPERIAVDYGDPNELAEKLTLAKKALASGGPAWKPLRARGIFYGKGPSPKVAFLYPGQGSQYVNMLAGLAREPEVHAVFEEADRVMAPKLGRPLTEILFADPTDSARMQQADEELRQTAVTQPAVLAVDAALTRLLASYGVVPDLVMGHSLGEYGALVAAEALPFADALEAVAARGKEMTAVSLDDNGKMAAVMGPYAEIERVLASVRDYVVIANINSSSQVVIGGSSAGVDAASQALLTAGFQVIPLPVSHAFHTSIVAPASEPLRRVLERLRLAPPKTPVVANVDGELYPAGSGAVDEMLDILARQVAEPVQFVKGLERAYAEGVRLFVEVGPKRALQGFAEDVLGAREGVLALYTNHPKLGDAVSFNQALAGLYASGLGATRADARPSETTPRAPAPVALRAPVAPVAPAPAVSAPELPRAFAPSGGAPPYAELGRMFAEFVERTHSLIGGGSSAPSEPIVVSGAALGLPGTPHVFESDAVARLLHGEQLIDVIPTKLRKAMLDKHITRLVKKEGKDPVFEAIDNEVDVIKLAGRGGAFDLTAEYGVPKERVEAFDITTQLAFAAGLDALRDAGIPLVPRYKTTSKGTLLPDGWALPESMRDDTGIVFASAFPGYDHLIGQLTHFFEDRARRDRLVELQSLRARTGPADGNAVELDRRIHELEVEIQERAFTFDRRFLFQVLAMGHSQFAEYIRARGPNTQVNSACASTTQAINIAEDWIRLGRCRRVIVVAADDITSDTMLGWFASGFLATGAAATEEVVEEVATPFDRRRHGMLVGMGAAALVLESKVALAERGIAPITELLGTITANSAFHGTRLDVEHISGIMESLVASVERRFGIGRAEMASRMVFVSHETYTPARGGSAAAEIFALRRVFGAHAERIVIANTKGFTGHAMGAGIEDVLAVKSLETGIVPPVPNFKEVDPELGVLNLSQGGSYPIEFALRLGAGFGSQISMTLMRRGTSGPRAGVHALGFEGRIQDRARFQSWLGNVSGEASPTLEVVQRTLRIKDSRMTSGARGRAPEAPSAVRAAAVPEAKPRAAAPAPPTPPPAAPVPSAPARDEVAERVLALVADKTGYPRDMLALDLDLEADLGIDTVKQAEVFASIRSAYDIPRDDQLKLRDYPTLAHVIEFVRSRRPDLGAAPAAASPVPVAPAAPVRDEVAERVLALVADKTGYPRDMLALDLDLEADLGIDTVKQAEVFASIRSAYDIPRDDQLKLRDYPTLAHVIEFVRSRRPDLGAAPVAAAAAAVAPASPSGDEVTESVLGLVADKTGYPRDMLALDLDLEADLGIDTVKQAEVFASIRSAYDIPRDDQLKLRDYPTLAHVIEFVRSRRPDLGAPVAKPVAAPAPAAFDEVTERVLALVAEKTGYPRDMLDLDLDLEADLGIDTVKQAEVFASIRSAYDIPRDDQLKLRDYPTLAHVTEFVRSRRPDLGAPVAKPAAAPAPAAFDEVTERVLALVAEKTGYPRDMLDLDLDLEADLGIDTVKQAEVFASIRSAYDIPRDDQLKLRDYPTLKHVVRFVEERRQKGPAPALAEVSGRAASPSAAAAYPRRVPLPVLRPDLSVCKPTGVELAPGARVIVVCDAGPTGALLGERLRARGVEVLEVAGEPSGAELLSQARAFLAQGAVTGVYFLSTLEVEPELWALDPAAWKSLTERRVKAPSHLMRELHAGLGAGRFFVSATRMGGLHGYGRGGAASALGGALSGFTKALARERAQALVKCVDFELEAGPEGIAEQLVHETLRDPGAVEVGIAGGRRFSVGFEVRTAAAGGGLTLDANCVYVVTGAAGSITSAITRDLASSGGTFWLLDLTPEPPRQSPDLDRLASDREGLKRELFERAKARGERATPATVEQEVSRLERAQAARMAIRAVEERGGRAEWRSLDLRDADRVREVVDEIRRAHGRVDVLVHAAGIEISRSLPDKSPAEFDLVWDVKCDGAANLLRALEEMPLGAFVAFSSIAGRFGNRGQTDYSSANDFLCKLCSKLAQRGVRAVAIDWTAWAEIGMASRGSIPTIMAAAGIDMLPPAVGVPIVRRELETGAPEREIIAAGSLGLMLEERAPEGGIEPGAYAGKRLPMLGRVLEAGQYAGLVVEAELDPTRQRFLDDHRIEGVPVLPGVMGLEAFAEAALLLAPDAVVRAIENVEFLAPFKFYRDEPRRVRVEVAIHPEREELVGRARLLGTRTLADGKTETKLHFSADVRLSTRGPEVKQSSAPTPSANGGVGRDAIYRIYFHGPAYRVIDKAWRAEEGVTAELATALPPNHDPPELPLAAAPRLIEACFQTAGVWEIGTTGRMGLPQHIDRVEVSSRATDLGGALFATAAPRDGGFDAVVVDAEGHVLVSLSGYRTAELPAPIAGELLSPLSSAMR